MPNLGGPNTGCRRLYAGVVRSMALYGAPVWAGSLSARNRALLWRPQRAMAVRAIRGYRTVSTEAACALAGTPPWDLEAEVLAEAFRRMSEARMGGRFLPHEEQGTWRHDVRIEVVARWKARLQVPRAGLWTLGAIQPVLEQWLSRQHGALTFRLVQMLSGHGCFGKYLHKIAGKETSPICHHCGYSEDTAQHTLEVCAAWTVERRELVTIVGGNLSLPAIVRIMISSARMWSAVATFCETVISRKEAAERVREANAASDSIRRLRAGRRMRAYMRLMPP